MRMRTNLGLAYVACVIIGSISVGGCSSHDEGSSVGTADGLALDAEKIRVRDSLVEFEEEPTIVAVESPKGWHAPAPAPADDPRVRRVQRFDGAIREVVPLRRGRHTVYGFRIVLDGKVDVTAHPLGSMDLSGISLNPKVPLVGVWVAGDQLDVTWVEYPPARESLQIHIEELPVEGKRVAVIDASRGPWSFSLPPLRFEAVSLVAFEPGRYAELSVALNRPVKAEDLRAWLQVAQATTTKRVPMSVDLTVLDDAENATHIIRLESDDLQSEQVLQLRLPAISGITGRVFDSNPVKLRVPNKMHITALAFAEGTKYYSVDVRCHYSDSYDPGKGRSGRCNIGQDMAEAHIQIAPPVSVQVVPDRDGFRLLGPFKPNITYDIRFVGGLRGENGEQLMSDYHRVMAAPEFKPKIRFVNKARYLPRVKGTELQFEARNIPNVKISLSRIATTNKIISWLTSGREDTYRYDDEVHSSVVEFAGDTNDWEGSAVSLEALQRFGKGVYAISAYDLRSGHRFNDRAVLVVTNMGVVAKRSGKPNDDTVHFWVRSLEDTAPMPGVAVAARDFDNNLIGSCRTDHEGYCHIRDMRYDGRRASPVAFFLEKGEDFSYVRLSDVELPIATGMAALRSYSSRGQGGTLLEPYLYSSRGVYRPGEVIDLGAVIRTYSYGAVGGANIQWRIKNPRGKTIRSGVAKTSVHGMLAIQYSLDDYAPTGKYLFELESGNSTIGSYGFLVEEFVPERVKIKYEPESAYSGGARDATFEIGADYLFGAPVAGGEYVAHCSIEPAWRAVPGVRQFVTGTYRQSEVQLTQLANVQGNLDGAGKGRAKCEVGGALRDLPTVMRIRSSVEVREAGSGRVSYQSSDTLIGRGNYILGLRKQAASATLIKYEGRIFDHEGNIQKVSTEAVVEMFRMEREWYWSWDDRSHRSDYKQTLFLIPEGAPKKITITNGTFEQVHFPAEADGAYLVRVTLPETGYVAELDVYLNGNRWYWAGYGYHRSGETPKPRTPGQLELTLSSNEVEAGQPVTMRVATPAAGYLFWTLETDDIGAWRWTRVDKGAHEIAFKAPNVLPNVYVNAMFIQDPVVGDYYVPGRQTATEQLRIKPAQHILQVDIDTPVVVRPNSELAVRIVGTPSEAFDYTVAIVDEGILQLTNFQTPDPIAELFAPRALGTRTYETIGWTFERTQKMESAQGGGRGQRAQAERIIPVRIVSFWSGTQQAGPDGVGTFKVRVPAFQGQVRVMVVAASNDRVGSGDGTVFVRDPVVVQATAPRFVIEGDRFDVPVFLANTTRDEQLITLSLSSPHGLTIARPNREIKLGVGDQKTEYFKATVNKTYGTATLEFFAKGASQSTKDKIEIPIKPLTPEFTATVVQKATRKLPLKSFIPDAMRPESATMNLTLSPMPYLDSAAALGALLRYPYGCVEQTVSRGFPALYAKELFALVKADRQDHIRADQLGVVYSTISRLFSMQTPDRGFSYWPGYSASHFWSTAYALHFLFEARRAGFEVPGTIVEDGLDSLLNMTRAVQGSRRTDDAARGVAPYALYVLALAGHDVAGLVEHLEPKVLEYKYFNEEHKFLMMATYRRTGNVGKAEMYERDEKVWQPSEIGNPDFDYSFRSALRSDAMRLAIAEELWPGGDRQEPLALLVARQMRQSTEWNTQQLAWASIGLGRRSLRYAGAEVTLASLRLGDDLLQKTEAGRNHLWKLTGSDLDRLTVELSYEANFEPYIYVDVVGYYKDYSTFKENRELDIKRRYKNLDGKVIDVGSIRQGDLVVVELELFNHTQFHPLQNVAVVDRMPAGLEIENANLGRDNSRSWMSEMNLVHVNHRDQRDDRVQFFLSMPNTGPRFGSNKSRYLHYVARAVSAGQYTAPPARIEAMYDPRLTTYSEPTTVTVHTFGTP